MERRIEFAVEGIVTGISGRLHVIGRNCEDVIRLGDTLEASYQYQRETDDARGTNANGADSRRKINPKEVKLSVVAIRAYDHDLDELQPGMTGSLSLEGTGSEVVVPGSLLSAEVECANSDSRPRSDVSRPTTAT